MNFNRDDLQNTLRQVALPAMVGAAGTGALGAYMSRHPLEGESPSQRRHRIVRNALIAASLGGMAGATLPTGIKTLAQPYFDSANEPSGRGVVSQLGDVGMRHLGAGLGGGAAYFGLARPWALAQQGGAKKYIFDQLAGKPVDDAEAAAVSGVTKVTDPAHVTQLLESGPAGRRFVLGQLAGGPAEPGIKGEPYGRLFRAAELTGTATGRSVRSSELRDLFPSGIVSGKTSPIKAFSAIKGETGIPGSRELEQRYLNYLSEGADMNPLRRLLQAGRGVPTPSVPNWLARLGVKGLGEAEAGVEPRTILSPLRGLAGRAAEAYSTFGRPEAARMLSPELKGMFRHLPLGRLGLLSLPLAGAYLGSQAQKSLTGD